MDEQDGETTQRKEDDMTRFWAKVARKQSSECWAWLACVFAGTGYGCFGFRGRNWGAHRVAWVLTHGEIPAGMFVCHRCDNKQCVNPSHLFLGTPGDNLRDMSAKGRGGRPIKLDFAAVVRMRGEGKSQREIARALGVTQPCVSQFLRGHRRSHPDSYTLIELD